jgi:hypothetical protein
MNVSEVRELMEVVGSCGNHVGRVEAVEGHSIKLARGADDQTHYISLEWVASVGQTVRLDVTAAEARAEWNAAPVGAGTG